MTRLERKQQGLNRLYEYRRHFMAANDIISMSRIQSKIEDLEKEVENMKRYEPIKLGEFLDKKGEDVKNEIYHAFLRISVLADVVNEAATDVAELLKKHGATDFTFRDKVAALKKLSQEIATVPLLCGAGVLEDLIVDDDDVVDGCMEIADTYIKAKTGI